MARLGGLLLVALCVLAVAPMTFLSPKPARMQSANSGLSTASSTASIWFMSTQIANAVTGDNFDPASMPSQYSAFGPEAAKDNEALLNFFLGSAFFGLFASQVAGRYKKDDDLF